MQLRLRNLIGIAVLSSLSLLFARTVSAQALTWNLYLVDTAIRVSGQISHSGVAAATYNGKLYAAYSDHSSDGRLWLTYQLNQYNHSQPIQVPGAVVNNNPTMAVYNNKLWLFWIDYPSGYLEVASTTDGVNFLYRGACSGIDPSNPYQSPYDSPSATVFGSNMVVGFRTAKNYVGLCWITESPTQAYTTWATYPGNYNLGEAPGLGVFKGKLYIAYKDTSGSNYIYLLTSTDGANFSLSTAATFNHTSAQPNLAVYNGALYIGYRQNSSDFHFYYTYSTDGANFAAWTAASFTMGGPSGLVVGPDGRFYNIFSQNANSHYLSSAVANRADVRCRQVSRSACSARFLLLGACSLLRSRTTPPCPIFATSSVARVGNHEPHPACLRFPDF